MHDLQVGDDRTPAAVGIDLGPLWVEFDGPVVHAVGLIQHHLAVERGRLDVGEGAIVDERGALVFDDAAGDLGPDIDTISMMMRNWPSSSASTSRSSGIGTSGSRS